AEDAVRADASDVHDAARCGGLTEPRGRRGAARRLSERDVPRRLLCISRCEVRGIEPDEVDAARAPRCDPGEVVRALVAVDSHGSRPGHRLIARMAEPDV